MVNQLPLFEHPKHNDSADGLPTESTMYNREKKVHKNVRAAGAQLISELNWLNYNLKYLTQYVSKQQRIAWRLRKTELQNQLNQLK